jgi:hypothetical protein
MEKIGKCINEIITDELMDEIVAGSNDFETADDERSSRLRELKRSDFKCVDAKRSECDCCALYQESL